MTDRTRRKPDLRGVKQCGENLYQIRVTWTDPATGKRTTRKALIEGTLADALVKRDELRQEPRRTARPRLEDYAASWLESRLRTGRIGVSTADKYARDLDLHILPRLGKVYLDRLRPSTVEPVLGAEHAGDKRLRMMRAMAKDALADGLVERDFTARLHVPLPEGYTEDEPNMLTAEQLGALLVAAERKERAWHAVLIVLGYTGLRWGEASALRWEDLDRQRDRIRVRRGNWKGVALPKPKTRRQRSVPLGAELAEVLRAHQRHMVAEQHPGLASGWLFPVARQRPRKRRGTDPWLHTGTPLRAVLERLCAAAAVPRITTHGLRRTFNDLGRRVTDRLVLQSITGHVTDAMTDHYSRVDDGERRAGAGGGDPSRPGARCGLGLCTWSERCELSLEVPPGFEPGMEVLQTYRGPVIGGAYANIFAT